MSGTASDLGDARADDPAEIVRLGAVRLRGLTGAPAYTQMLATMLGYLADHEGAPDGVLAARMRAFALEAARAALHEHPAAAPEPADDHGAGPTAAGVDWYGRDWGWDNPQIGLRGAVPFLAEMSGAGIVAADAGDAGDAGDTYWRGYSSEPHWDARGDGRLVDVKRAWTEDADTLGFCGPTKPNKAGQYRYDEDQVDDIMLVHLEDEDVTTTHGYEPDGEAFLTMRGRPLAAYRIPTPVINNMLKTGVIRRISKLRFTVAVSALLPYQVRGPRSGNGSPSPQAAPGEDTVKRPQLAEGEQTT